MRCDIINGVDPNPGNGDETGFGHPRHQNIGRSGGVGASGPGASGTPAPPTINTTVVEQVLNQVLDATPFSSALG